MVFGYISDRVGFWYGQRRLSLIGQSHAVKVIAIPERSAASVDRQTTVATVLEEPTESPVDTSLEAPAYS
jgi:hypothetical protein